MKLRKGSQLLLKIYLFNIKLLEVSLIGHLGIVRFKVRENIFYPQKWKPIEFTNTFSLGPRTICFIALPTSKLSWIVGKYNSAPTGVPTLALQMVSNVETLFSFHRENWFIFWFIFSLFERTLSAVAFTALRLLTGKHETNHFLNLTKHTHLISDLDSWYIENNHLQWHHLVKWRQKPV